jgi:putative PIN family toxin of toxin-antitoxin system
MISTSEPAPRVVLDSKVLLSALVFAGGTLGRFRSLWTSGTVVPCASKQTTKELILLLANKKFKLDRSDQESLLADYLPFVQVTDISPKTHHANLPICRDPHDQMFLELALASKANFLVTGDQDLLVLASTPNLTFRILKPIEFLTEQKLLT